MRIGMLIVACVLTIGLGGCQAKHLTGRWRGVAMEGNDPRVFSVGRIEFKQDGSFNGIITVDDKRRTLEGYYRYDGLALTLTTTDGVERYPVVDRTFFKRALTLKRDGVTTRIERVGQ